MDFNADGELFAYDADMEWDMGSPWYRPTRVTHADERQRVRLAERHRQMAAVLCRQPARVIVNIGPGSPVGVTFGYGAKFPAKYQKALYISTGRSARSTRLHLEPERRQLPAVKEEFVSRTPLPLTDAAVGPDGALYFTIGGRGTQSELFRVTYVGEESTRCGT
jgi:glucose/arabinose dehydrogenase